MTRPRTTLSVAKRSLGHFAAGRLISAVVGIGTLLLIVRTLGKSDYGVYVTLLAAFEIAQLAASPGAYAVAFRYLPELRAKGATSALGRMVVGVTAYRLATLSVVAAAVALGAESLATWLGATGQAHAIRMFALVLVFEGTARFVDVQFESLLLQGLAQLSILARNGAKLAMLAIVSSAGTMEIALQSWLKYEVAAAAIGVGVSCTMMALHLRRQTVEDQGTGGMFPLARLWKFALPTYLSQVAYVASGTEMVKILVSKLVGTAVTAAFGFAAALASTLQRYMPSFLLVGWIRPLLITAYNEGQSGDAIARLAGTVLKLNLLMLAPMAAMVAVAGPEIVDVLAGGRLPGSLPYLQFFLVLLIFQSLRTVLSLLGVTLELGVASLRATFFSVIGLAGGILLSISDLGPGACAPGRYCRK